ncbi:MAG TPA: GNAT family N-acetyltransferase [Thermoplasmata archaeon]|jgi:GNAT superfamily N-acetyltransferase
MPGSGNKRSTAIVRGYRRSDLENCRRLWEELTVKHREIYDDPSIGGDHPGMFFDEHLKLVGARRIWVAVQDSEVVGFVGLVVEGEDAEIEPLVVTKKLRGTGIGAKLTAAAAAKASRTEGVKYLTVRPVARNVEAMRFFHDMGMVNVGRIELFKDLKGRKWKQGLRIHDIDLGY